MFKQHSTHKIFGVYALVCLAASGRF